MLQFQDILSTVVFMLFLGDTVGSTDEIYVVEVQNA